MVISLLVIALMAGLIMRKPEMVRAAVNSRGKIVKVIGITSYNGECFVAYKEDFKGDVVKLLPPIAFKRSYGRVIKVRS